MKRPVLKKLALLTVSHIVIFAIGFAAGVYFLPVLIAPEAPSAAEVASRAASAEYKAQFRRDLKGSDPFHWGEGAVAVGRQSISFTGKLAPGPDYKLYLASEFVDSKDGFVRIKGSSLRLGDVKTFDNFIVAVPETVDVSKYNTVVVWCETFSMFITAAKYR